MEQISALKKARLVAGLTQEALADATYGSQQSIHKYEKRKASPTVAEAISICRVLGVDPEETFLAMMNEPPLEPMGKISLAGARGNAGLSQREVAEAVGVQLSTYCYWERGKYMPNIYRALEICKVFGCKLEQIDWEGAGHIG